MNNLLIVDAIPFIIATKATSHYRKNGLLSGLNYKLERMMERNDCEQVIFAWDPISNDHLFRRDIYKNYKKNRQNKSDNKRLMIELSTLASLLREKNIKSMYNDRVEADDIIGSLTQQFKDKFDNVFIYSCDTDLCQLLDINVFMIHEYSYRYKGRDVFVVKFINRYTFEKSKGVKVKDYTLYKSLVGDKADNYLGYFSKMQAIKFIEGNGNINNIPSSVIKKSGKSKITIINNVKRNLMLAKLKTDINLNVKYSELIAN